MFRLTRLAYRGLRREKATGRWLAAIKYAGREFFLGGYETKEEAIVAFNYGVVILYGVTGQPIPIESQKLPRLVQQERIKADVVSRLSQRY
jgi:hypothetical protein